MSELHHYQQPQITRRLPVNRSQLPGNRKNHGTFIPYTEIQNEEEEGIPVVDIVVHLGGKVIDKGAEVAGTLIVQSFTLAGTILVYFFRGVGYCVRGLWTAWTTSRPEWEDNRGQSNHHHGHCGCENRNYEVHIHYH